MSRHGATMTRPAEPEVTEPHASLPASPWPVAGIRWLGLVVLVAGVVLAAAWYGCSGETIWRVQVRWFGLGVLACALNALGCLIWLGVGLRALRRERAWTTVELHKRDLTARRIAPEGPGPDAGLVSSARMRRYHRADCPLMAGKSPVAVTAESALALRACGVCAS